MVTYRADAAYSGRNYWHLPEDPTLTEFFETSKLCYIELGISYIACFVQLDSYFAMSFNSANRVYFNCFFINFSNHVFTSFNRSASYRWAEPEFCLPAILLRHTR